MADLLLSMLETIACIVTFFSFVALTIWSGARIGTRLDFGADTEGSRSVDILLLLVMSIGLCIFEAIRAGEDGTTRNWTFLQGLLYVMGRAYVEGAVSFLAMGAVVKYLLRML